MSINGYLYPGAINPQFAKENIEGLFVQPIDETPSNCLDSEEIYEAPGKCLDLLDEIVSLAKGYRKTGGYDRVLNKMIFSSFDSLANTCKLLANPYQNQFSQRLFAYINKDEIEENCELFIRNAHKVKHWFLKVIINRLRILPHENLHHIDNKFKKTLVNSNNWQCHVQENIKNTALKLIDSKPENINDLLLPLIDAAGKVSSSLKVWLIYQMQDSPAKEQQIDFIGESPVVMAAIPSIIEQTYARGTIKNADDFKFAISISDWWPYSHDPMDLNHVRLALFNLAKHLVTNVTLTPEVKELLLEIRHKLRINDDSFENRVMTSTPDQLYWTIYGLDNEPQPWVPPLPSTGTNRPNAPDSSTSSSSTSSSSSSFLGDAREQETFSITSSSNEGKGML